MFFRYLLPVCLAFLGLEKGRYKATHTIAARSNRSYVGKPVAWWRLRTRFSLLKEQHKALFFVGALIGCVLLYPSKKNKQAVLPGQIEGSKLGKTQKAPTKKALSTRIDYLKERVLISCQSLTQTEEEVKAIQNSTQYALSLGKEAVRFPERTVLFHHGKTISYNLKNQLNNLMPKQTLQFSISYLGQTQTTTISLHRLYLRRAYSSHTKRFNEQVYRDTTQAIHPSEAVNLWDKRLQEAHAIDHRYGAGMERKERQPLRGQITQLYLLKFNLQRYIDQEKRPELGRALRTYIEDLGQAGDQLFRYIKTDQPIDYKRWFNKITTDLGQIQQFTDLQVIGYAVLHALEMREALKQVFANKELTPTTLAEQPFCALLATSFFSHNMRQLVLQERFDLVADATSRCEPTDLLSRIKAYRQLSLYPVPTKNLPLVGWLALDSRTLSWLYRNNMHQWVDPVTQNNLLHLLVYYQRSGELKMLLIGVRPAVRAQLLQQLNQANQSPLGLCLGMAHAYKKPALFVDLSSTRQRFDQLIAFMKQLKKMPWEPLPLYQSVRKPMPLSVGLDQLVVLLEKVASEQDAIKSKPSLEQSSYRQKIRKKVRPVLDEIASDRKKWGEYLQDALENKPPTPLEQQERANYYRSRLHTRLTLVTHLANQLTLFIQPPTRKKQPPSLFENVLFKERAFNSAWLKQLEEHFPPQPLPPCTTYAHYVTQIE